VFLEELSRSRQGKRDIVLGTWNVRSLYRVGSLTAVARDLARYKLDLLGQRGTVRAGDYIFFLWKRKRKSSAGNRIFCTPKNSISS